MPPMLKALARIIEAVPEEHEIGGTVITLYRWEEKEWVEKRFRRTANLINNMLNEALRLAYERQPEKGYVFVEIETMGLRVMEGEGNNPDAETILSPIPTTLHKITAYKLPETGEEKASPVNEITLHGQHYVYDGRLVYKEQEQPDLIILETGRGLRVILGEELYLPKTKTPAQKRTAKKKRRKTRRQTAAKKKTRRTKRRKKSSKK